MITISIQQQVSATSQQLLALLTDHENLDRFINAKFKIVKQGDGELVGGIGCQRQISTLGQCFIEEITQADESGIHYHIVGDKPLKNHQGTIDFKPADNGVLIDYKIVGEPPFYQPKFIVKWLIERDIRRGMVKIAKHFSAS